MAPISTTAQSTHVAFIDLGTYSCRLLIVRINPNHSYTILSERKEPVRLGGDEFDTNELQPDAMERAVVVIREFAMMARGQGCVEIVAVATSATRDARNRAEFIAKVREATEVDLRVISGLEEARLVYLGVSRGTHLDGAQTLFIDLGGGSTELALGDERDFQFLDSVKVGAIRLTQEHQLDQHAGPVSDETYAALKAHAEGAAIRAIQQLRSRAFSRVIASSGTARAIAAIGAEQRGDRDDPDPSVSREEVKRVAELLRQMTLDERRAVPGLNPDRADLIVAGAAIFEALMDALEIEQLDTTRLGVRDGLLVNYLIMHPTSEVHGALTPRQLSVRLLGRRCAFDESHALHVANLTLQLFDEAQRLGLHEFDARQRELLEHAATLHDVGVFLSFVNHHLHTYYIVRHADLVGFDQSEIATIAALARFHRKGRPRKQGLELRDVGAPDVSLVLKAFLFLRMAERLDRGHQSAIQRVTLSRSSEKRVQLTLHGRSSSQMERWAVEKDREMFQRVLGYNLDVVFEDAELATAD